MNPQNWKPQDISEQVCPRCATPIEFWKDDIKRKCPKCGLECTNSTLKSSCISWCDQAEQCTGNKDIDEWKKQQQRNNTKE